MIRTIAPQVGHSSHVAEGLAELVQCPLTESPGERWPKRSPMHRWAVIGPTLVSILVIREERYRRLR